MRAWILVAAAAVTLTACNKKDAAGTATNVDSDLISQNIAANDTTAIDAATDDSANMAADVDFTVNEDDTPASDNKAAGDKSVRNKTAVNKATNSAD